MRRRPLNVDDNRALAEELGGILGIGLHGRLRALSPVHGDAA